MPKWIGELTSLEILGLGFNPLGSLPPEISALRSLCVLELSDVWDGALDAVLSELTDLEVLSVSSNNLRTLPPWIGGFHKLRHLHVGHNAIVSLPDEFAHLRRLTHLYLWGHSLDEVPDVLSGLTTLEVLDLSAEGKRRFDTGPFQASWQKEIPEGMPMFMAGADIHRGNIRSLPRWLTASLPALRVLYARGQQLRALPSMLPSALEGIYLGNNQIEVFPSALFSLPALREIDLRDNRLRDLPDDLRHTRGLTYLDLAGNPLSIPPEILAASDEPAEIQDYLIRVSGPTRRLDEAKVVVVGEASVGKTSLVRRLVSSGFSNDEQKTEGIDVTEWSVDAGGDRIRLNIWDFGGQEIMHATHQFFLTRRSVYLLVIDARQDQQQNRIEYWLKLIESFSAHSPVIIVGNKTDQAVLDIDTRGLRNKYADIIDIRSLSCKTGEGIADIQSLLAASIERLSHVRDPLPEGFFVVKEVLERLDADFLPYRDYIHLCRQYGVATRTTQESLVGFLHDLGTVVCFRDDPRLADTNILNPTWVTSGVYRLLNAHRAAQKKGLLKWGDVDAILDIDDYPRDRRAFIIDMMKRFELCYESEGTFLIPDLLTREEPDTGEWDDALRFEITYDVLPSSIISRLIVRMHASLSKATVWRTGLVLTMDRNRALVKGDSEDDLVTITITGPANGRRGLLTAIRSELRSIEQTIPGLVGEERVPIPGRPGIWVSYRHLLNLEEARHREVIPQGLTEAFDISELLAGVESPGDRETTRMETPLAARPRRTAGASLENPIEPKAEARPWKPAEALAFGGLLLAALVVLITAFVGANQVVGTPAAVGMATAATTAVAIVGVLVLRSSGRVSELGLIETLRSVLRRD